MRVAETTEILEYIKGSNKPNKVRNILRDTQFTQGFYELRVLVFPSPSIDLSVGVQTTSRAPLCLLQVQVFYRRKARTKAERIGRVIVVDV